MRRLIVRSVAYGAELPADLALLLWRASRAPWALRLYLAAARLPLALHGVASRH
jgi:hypothetical protein